MFLRKVGLTFNGVYGIVYQKAEVFLTRRKFGSYYSVFFTRMDG
jgi:hypothetical protein